MNDDETLDRPEEVPEVADALTAALAAASRHRPPPELRLRVVGRVIRRQRLAPIWRYAAVAAIVAFVTGIVTWNVAAAQLTASRHTNADVAQLETTNEVVFDVIACKGGHVAILRATQQGSVSYGKLYTCPTSEDVVFMSGKLSSPPSGKRYELWLSGGGATRLQGALRSVAFAYRIWVLLRLDHVQGRPERSDLRGGPTHPAAGRRFRTRQRGPALVRTIGSHPTVGKDRRGMACAHGNRSCPRLSRAQALRRPRSTLDVISNPSRSNPAQR